MEATGQLQDEVLVERSKAGDRDAFSELVLKYQEQVLNLAFRRVGDRDMALDIAQETFLKAYRGLEAFEAKSRFYTWLHRITLNEATSSLRKLARHPAPTSLSPIDSDHGELEPVAVGFDPQAALQSQDEQSLVQAALTQIDEEFAGALILRDIEGLSYKEICEILELPLGTVKSKIHRGRLALKNLLSQVMESQ